MLYLPSEETAPLLNEYEIQKTADSIVFMQTEDGAIPKTPHGLVDVWNHLEAAMALTVAGRQEDSKRALLWVAKLQNADGSWHCSYTCDNNIADYSADTNQCAYLASASLHNFLFTKDINFLLSMWPSVVNALNFVLSHQNDRGWLPWSVDYIKSQDGADIPVPNKTSLFAASCSIYHSLQSASKIADLLSGNDGVNDKALPVANSQTYYDKVYVDKLKSKYSLAAQKLCDSLVGYMTYKSRKTAYIDKSLYAMDHYYNILASLPSEESLIRLSSAREQFILDGWGVRCLSDKNWFTCAETAEWAIAEASVGNIRLATKLLNATFRHRLKDGSYLTGSVYPNGNSFPRRETSSYSAAAVILADDVVSGGLTGALFSGYSVR